MVTEHQLDVSTLEAPEPLVLSTQALDKLQYGEWLHLFHRMKPCKLYDYMSKNGFSSKTCHGTDVECEVFIWHSDDEEAAIAANSASFHLNTWD